MDTEPGNTQQEIENLRAALARQQTLLGQLSDRQSIIDCTIRFCRGVNRRDKDLMRSVFHADALDDHGFFVGDPEGFVEWIDEVYARVSATQHFVTNHSIELDNDTAHVESYWFVANVGKDGVSVALRGGRYIDRFERREGRWAIAQRVCLIGWNAAPGELRLPDEALAMTSASGTSSTDRTDLSYQRPLRIARSATRRSPHRKP